MQKLKLKPIPDATKYPVIPPDMNYVYFEHAKQFPIQAKELNYSPVNAWWFAECSFLVYSHPGFARMAFLLAGYDNFKFFHTATTDCMVAWNKQIIIVSFRGTELNNISIFRDFSTNLDAKPVDFPEGGKVHQGFLKAFKNIWYKPTHLSAFLEQLMEKNPQSQLWFTGHSLGGALAGLAFTNFPVSFGLYTYGSPRIGNQEFVDLSKDKPIWRIEHAYDPIPLLPPDLPKINFIHMGKLAFITEDGKLLMNKEVLDISEQTQIAQKTFLNQLKRASNISNNFKDIKQHSNILSKLNIFRKNSQIAYSHLTENVSKSFTEWKNYMININKLAGVKIENHMPIYYCSKLWNILIK